MKRIIFILSVFLVVLLIVWMVGRFNRSSGGGVERNGYQASTRNTEIVIYDIDDLEEIQTLCRIMRS